MPLTPAVRGVLEGIPRIGDNPGVIAGNKPDAHLTNVNDAWLVVRAEAGLGDVRIHDLRHSWASRVLALGESLSMIAKLLGHNSIETTARYAHLARDSVRASAAKMYVVQSRYKGRLVRVTVGRHGVITADEARSRASRIVNHILPEFGKLPLMAVERERVAAFHAQLNRVPYTANRAVALMSRMYAKAADWEMVPDGTNPCREIERHRERRRERFLTDTEFRRLGEVLAEAPVKGGVSAHAVAAIRLLMLTGCQDGSAPGAAVAAGGAGARGHFPRTGQSLGDSRTEARNAHDQSGRPLADRAQVRPDRERSNPRLPVQPGADHRALCPSRARFGQGLGRARRRQHCGGFLHVTATQTVRPLRNTRATLRSTSRTSATVRPVGRSRRRPGGNLA